MSRWIRFLVLFIAAVHAVWAELPPVNTTIMVPMRDGSTLPTDLYLPTPEAKGLPCILVRTPSGRRVEYVEPFVRLAMAGYVVAVQDTRSAVDSEGKTMPFIHDGWGEQQDGYDAVEWLSKSSWTNGRIGTIGWSSMGITQVLMAPTAPPSLKCQYIGAASYNLYSDAIYGGGTLRKSLVENWLGYHAPHPSVLSDLISKPHYSEWWSQFNSTLVAERVNAPAVHLGGWYDIFLQGTIDAYVDWESKGGEGAKGRQKLVIGPWTHYYPKEDRLGDFKVPDLGKQPPYDVTAMTWFDCHLKGSDNGIDKVPSVIYYVMGPFDGTSSSGNVWKTAQKWPIPHTPTDLFLAEGGKLEYKESASERCIQLGYDPKNPVPTIGGRNLFMESGAKDQRPIEERSDVVVFTTEPLNEDLEVTGRVMAKLWISGERPNMDVAVRLCDVYPDGRSILIADGLSKIRSGVEGGKEVGMREIDVDLWSTSMVFAKGHSIRISLSGSNYPAYECCFKGVENPAAAQLSLLVGAATPSRIILPVVGN